MRVTAAVFLLAIGATALPHGISSAAAQAGPGEARLQRLTEASAQQRRRPRVRIYRETYDRGVVPSYFPGTNAVRDCSVSYVQEFRPSGTVIVPNMRCFWRQP